MSGAALLQRVPVACLTLTLTLTLIGLLQRVPVSFHQPIDVKTAVRPRANLKRLPPQTPTQIPAEPFERKAWEQEKSSPPDPKCA